MWGYQEHFKNHYEYLTGVVFEAIGFEGKAKIFMVGLAISDQDVGHVVCVEPETGQPDQNFFSSLPEFPYLDFFLSVPVMSGSLCGLSYRLRQLLPLLLL